MKDVKTKYFPWNGLNPKPTMGMDACVCLLQEDKVEHAISHVAMIA